MSLNSHQVESVGFSCVGLSNENDFLVAGADQLDESLVHCDGLLGALVSKGELHHQPLMPVSFQNESGLVGVGHSVDKLDLVKCTI